MTEENTADFPRLEDLVVVDDTSQTMADREAVTTIIQPVSPPWPPMVSGISSAYGTDLKDVSAETILKAIRAGRWQSRMDKIRSLPWDSKEQKRAKEQLPAIHWSGTFAKRGIEGLKTYSGIVCIDVDHLDSPAEVVARLIPCPHIVCAYVSPRGEGVKVLLDARGHDGETHHLAYRKACSLVQELTGHEPDNTPDVSRLCFVSFDPTLVVNWDTTPLSLPTEEEIEAMRNAEKERPKRDIEFKVTGKTTPYGKKALEAECQRILDAPNGQRNNTIFKASATIGELVAGGEIAEEDASTALEDAATTIGDDYQRDVQTVANGLLAGASSPRKAPEKDVRGKTVRGTGEKPEEDKPEEPVRLDRSAWGIVSGSELNKTSPKPHRWIIKDWVPEGLTKLVSPEKSGKTFLAMQMGISVASGRPFLGVFDVAKAGKVLYLGLEQSLWLNHERLLLMSKGESIPDKLDIVSAGSDWPPLDQGGLARLEAYIKEEKPALVVIDVWQALAPSANGRDNAYQADTKALRPLHGLANSTGTAILFIHHTRKGIVSAKDPSESTSGSRALDSVPDHNIFLNREHGSDDAVVKTKTRISRPIDDMALKFDVEASLWTYLGSGDEHTLNIQRTQILEILSDAKTSDSALSTNDVVDLLAERGIERSVPAVRVQLNRMCDAGQIQKVGSGKRGQSLRYYSNGEASPDQKIEPLTWDSGEDENGFLL